MALNILKDAGLKLEGNLSIVVLMSMGAPRCCQTGGNTVYSLSQHLVSLLRSVVKLWNPDLKNGTLLFCLGQGGSWPCKPLQAGTLPLSRVLRCDP